MLGANGLAALSPLQMGAIGVAAGIAAIGVASIKAATDFDYNMQKIAALTNTSAAQMQSYKQQLLDMAPALDQTPVALAQGLYFVISAGYSGAQALDILKLSAQAAASTMTPMQSVADLLTTAMNAYRGANVSAGHAMDDLMSTVVQGKVTMSSLATSMGFVLVTAKNAGLSIDQASAAVATLSQVAGEHGSRRVMMDLDNAMRSVGIEAENVSKKAEAMKGLKAPWDAAKFAAMSFMEKLQYIGQETGGVGYLNKTQAAAYEATGNMQNLAQATAHANTNFMTLVGGAAAFIPAAMLLSDKGKEYNQILKTMGGNGQKTAQSFVTMRQSVGQQWQMFKTTLVTIATVLGENLLPAVSKILMPLIALGHGIIAFTQSSSGISTLKYILLGLALVIVGILHEAIIGLIGVLGTLAAPVVAVIGMGIALGLIIRAVVAHFGGWHAILQKLQPVLNVVKTLLAQAGEQLRKAFANPQIQAAWKQLQAALPGLLPVLKAIAVVVGVVLFVAFKLWVGAATLLIRALPLLITVAAGVLTVLGKIGQFLVALFTGKVFAAIGDGLGKLGRLLGDFFGGIGSWIGSKLGGAGQAIGDFFSGLGTIVHTGLMTVLGIVTGVFHAIGNFFPWLYHHNYYVQAMVDFIRERFQQVRSFLQAALNAIQTFIQSRWQNLQNNTLAAWTFIYQHIITPVQQVWSFVTGKIGQLKDWLLARWTDIKNDVQKLWNGVVSFITGLTARMGSAVQDHVVKPIQDKIQDMIRQALTWGTNLIKMFIQGILSQAANAKQAAGNVLHGIASFLGFHSPAPAVPESAYWGRNLVQMFANSMLLAAPQVGLAAARVIAQAQRQLASGSANANVGVTGAGGAAGSAFSVAGAATGALAGGAGGGTTTINVTFPGVKSKDEIKQALQELQQGDYRAARRPGSYGGLTAHTARF